MTANILLAAWAVFWGVLFAAWVDPAKGRRFDRVTMASLLALVVFPVLCVHAARSWP